MVYGAVRRRVRCGCPAVRVRVRYWSGVVVRVCLFGGCGFVVVRAEGGYLVVDGLFP